MSKACRVIYKICIIPKKIIRRFIAEPVIKHSFKKCGKNVRVQSGFKISGIENLSVGHNVALGSNMCILTTRAQVIMGNYIMFGPNVTIITGNHRIDVIGKNMYEITDTEKRLEDDQDVIIEDDVWIGSNVTILKGVTIGKGSVVAAGSVVNKSCPQYSIIGGVPAKVIKSRFTEEEIKKHEQILSERIWGNKNEIINCNYNDE